MIAGRGIDVVLRQTDGARREPTDDLSGSEGRCGWRACSLRLSSSVGTLARQADTQAGERPACHRLRRYVTGANGSIGVGRVVRPIPICALSRRLAGFRRGLAEIRLCRGPERSG